MKLGIPLKLLDRQLTKLRNRLKPSTWLQLRCAFGMLTVQPLWWLAFQLPMFRDCPLWFEIAFPVLCFVLGLIWFRQCLSPDGASFKPKWY